MKPRVTRRPLERRRFVDATLSWLDAAKSITDPALVGLLEREQRQLARQLEAAPTATETKRALAGLLRPLFPYQVAGVSRFLSTGRLLLADDMGLGKTAQAIASCHVLHATARVKRGLVIVPAALKPQWLREWQLFTRVPATIVDGPPAARHRQYRALEGGFLIVNYEQVIKDLPELERLAPDLVVLDEAQRIKNWAAKTSVAIKLDAGKVGAGTRVLVHGGVGGVGGLAVQLAAQRGAEVFATVGTNDVERARALGVTHPIDYRTQRFEDVARELDFVFDTVGGATLTRSWAVIKRGGTVASLHVPPTADALRAAGLSAPWFLRALLPVVTRGPRKAAAAAGARLAPILSVPNVQGLDLLAHTALRVTVGEVFPFDALGAALDHVTSGKARGRVALKT